MDNVPYGVAGVHLGALGSKSSVFTHCSHPRVVSSHRERLLAYRAQQIHSPHLMPSLGLLGGVVGGITQDIKLFWGDVGGKLHTNELM